MAKKKTKPSWTDYEGNSVGVGSRVELHPGMDLWMRGAKYGTITMSRKGKPCVRMDHKGVRKLVCVIPDNIRRTR